jgi:3-isopropylmalate/(R)-2-methylmalate dehydratase small subunit
VEKFTIHTGTALPLRRSNVDTDQIIPASYLKRITRSGFEDGLFASWRANPDFVLNQPQYADASILVAGSDFGTGSSREHAVWALLNHGFKVVISSRFGDIFRGNAGKSGLLVALVDDDTVAALWELVELDPTAQITVDLENMRVRAGDVDAPFEIDDYTRWRLLEGLDDVDLTLSHEADISTYEGKRLPFKPVTTPL